MSNGVRNYWAKRVFGERGIFRTALGWLWRVPMLILSTVVTAWCVLAIAYAPWGPATFTCSVAVGFAFLCLALAAAPLPELVRGRAVRWSLMLLLWAAVFAWYWLLPAPSEGDWTPDVKETAQFQVEGNSVRIHNIRNFQYRSSDTDFKDEWIDESYDLNSLQSLDLFFSFWGPTLICHNFVSFGFLQPDGTTKYLAVSIETRKRVGQDYSAVGGLFRQYPLIYIWATEADVVRVRTNFRGETVHRYRIASPSDGIRIVFERYMLETTRIVQHPMWYNAMTQNCGVDILRTVWGNAIPMFPPPAMLMNGTWEQQAWDEGRAGVGMSFEAMLSAADITADAKAATFADFSRAIRQREVEMGAKPITVRPVTLATPVHLMARRWGSRLGLVASALAQDPSAAFDISAATVDTEALTLDPSQVARRVLHFQ